MLFEEFLVVIWDGGEVSLSEVCQTGLAACDGIPKVGLDVVSQPLAENRGVFKGDTACMRDNPSDQPSSHGGMVKSHKYFG